MKTINEIKETVRKEGVCGITLEETRVFYYSLIDELEKGVYGDVTLMKCIEAAYPICYRLKLAKFSNIEILKIMKHWTNEKGHYDFMRWNMMINEGIERMDKALKEKED